MKITKKQLKKIIKEEKTKLLNEVTMGFTGTGFGHQSKETLNKSASFWGGAEPVSDVLQRRANKSVNESITDMNKYDAAFDDFSMKIADMFEADMMELYDEDPDLIRGDKADWQEQVVYAAQEIETGVAEAVRRAVEMIESRLHNGNYSQ